jgi:hypothetical protein
MSTIRKLHALALILTVLGSNADTAFAGGDLLPDQPNDTLDGGAGAAGEISSAAMATAFVALASGLGGDLTPSQSAAVAGVSTALANNPPGSPAVISAVSVAVVAIVTGPLSTNPPAMSSQQISLSISLISSMISVFSANGIAVPANLQTLLTTLQSRSAG